MICDRGGAPGEALLGGEGDRAVLRHLVLPLTGHQQPLAASVLELGQVGGVQRADLDRGGHERLRAVAGGVVAEHVHGERGGRSGAALVVAQRGHHRGEDRLEGGVHAVVGVDAARGDAHRGRRLGEALCGEHPHGAGGEVDLPGADVRDGHRGAVVRELGVGGQGGGVEGQGVLAHVPQARAEVEADLLPRRPGLRAGHHDRVSGAQQRGRGAGALAVASGDAHRGGGAHLRALRGEADGGG